MFLFFHLNIPVTSWKINHLLECTLWTKPKGAYFKGILMYIIKKLSTILHLVKYQNVYTPKSVVYYTHIKENLNNKTKCYLQNN